MVLAEVDRVDLVAFHQVGELDLHGESRTFERRAFGDGEDVSVEARHEAGRVVQRDGEGSVSHEAEDGSGRSHRDVEQKDDVGAGEEV